MARHRSEAGFTLIEAVVALMICAMIVIQFLGIRTQALIDTSRARNWRLAREIAEEKMSELQAGARELPPESGELVRLDEKYDGFSFKIVIGESAVADLEAEVAGGGSGGGTGDAAARERSEWQRNRENYRRASSEGISAMEYQDRLAEDDYRLRMAEKAPSDSEFEEVAVVVYFPKLDPEYPDEQEALLIKAKVSTLALSGMTPQQAQAIADSKGQNSGNAAPGGAGGSGLPGGGGSSGGDQGGK